MIDAGLVEQYQRDGAGVPLNHPLFPVLWCLQA
jgi:hypothetical protein